MYYYDDRYGFVVPFLLGAVTGGAAIGFTSRPRPYNSYPANYYPYSYPYYR